MAEGPASSGERRLRRRVLVGLVVLGAGGALAAVAACLPNLTDLPPLEVDAEAGAAAVVGCGDGIVLSAGEECDPGDAGDASASGCTRDCKIACSGGDVFHGHCYFAIDQEGSYNDARTACGRQGAHVVTFASDEEAKFVERLAARAPGYANGYWVGLAHDDTLAAYKPAREVEPGFPQVPTSGPCPGCYGLGLDGADVDAAYPESPLFDAGPSKGCIVARAEKWELVPCTQLGASSLKFLTMCEREPVGRRIDYCGSAFCFTLPFTEKRYVLDVSPSTAAQAGATCRDLYGGRVVIFDSREEREAVANEILALFPPEPAEHGYWVGAVEDAGAWTWEDNVPVGDPPRPSPWGDHQGMAPVPGARGYLRIVQNAYDTQLVYASNPSEQRPTLCERPPM